MEQRFPMENGQLVCWERNGRIEAAMEVRPSDKGLYHGYLVGPGGTWDLGTLMPEGGSLRLHRTLSAAQLRQAARSDRPIPLGRRHPRGGGR